MLAAGFLHAIIAVQFGKGYTSVPLAPDKIVT